MTDILIAFLGILIILAVVLAVAVRSRIRKSGDIDRQYLDERGDHTYYDRSIIEKREYRERYPEKGEPRKLRNLFRRRD